MNRDPNPDIIVVGAGYTGLSAALEFAKAGWKTILLEKEPNVGGLAATFQIEDGLHLEKTYHHWFRSDHHLINLLEETDLGQQYFFRSTRTGYYRQRLFPMAGVGDLLRFPQLPVKDRLRALLLPLFAYGIRNWRELESITAQQWISGIVGSRCYQTLWQPLLEAKFGAWAPSVSAVWIWNKLKLRLFSRNWKQVEQLGYPTGGFDVVHNAIIDKLNRLGGVRIHTEEPVVGITTANGEIKEVITDKRTYKPKAVLVTVPLPVFRKICPDLPELYRSNCDKIQYLSNICVILALKNSLSPYYWINIADRNIPFVVLVEQTNLNPPDQYGDRHIVYLSNYLPASDSVFTAKTDKEVFQDAADAIQRIFPSFTISEVLQYFVFRHHHAQPLAIRNYSEMLPPHRTPIAHLWLATMAQVYPQDRGLNYAVSYGRRVARQLLAELNVGPSR